jgi:hypothetical protein
MEINYKKQYKKLKAKCSTQKLMKKLELMKLFRAHEKASILKTIPVK